MTTALVLTLATVLAAPPPKNAAPEGRIFLVVDKYGLSMKPNGTEITTFKPPDLPDRVGQSPYHYRLTPNGKTALAVDHSDRNAGNGIYKSKLLISHLNDTTGPFQLDGFVAIRSALSRDGKTAYLSGLQKEEMSEEDIRKCETWSLDIAAKKLKKSLTVPPGHLLDAVSADEKYFITSKGMVENNQASWQTYRTPANGDKPVEMLKPNAFVDVPVFSPDGSKLLTSYRTYSQVSAGKNGISVSGASSTECVIIDLETMKATAVRRLPDKGYLNVWAWSPDSGRIAYVWSFPKEAAVPAPAAPGAPVPNTNELHLFVANADGGEPKEVHKIAGTTALLLAWR
jgi:hypothetical protein